MASRANVFLLGAPRIMRDGAAAAVDTRKAIALLAYLAVTGAPQRRDSLAALLWPEYDQTAARAALRRTLSSLNKALDGEGLVVSREQIGLGAEGGISLDVWEFESRLRDVAEHGHDPSAPCPACDEHLARGIDLYAGDFMAGFALRDSPPFDDWQYAQAERLRRKLAEALQRSSGSLMAGGKPEAAIAAAQRWVQLDPMQEAAQRSLMALYAAAGQRASALRQYRECVRVLDEELGVTPLQETTELYEAIREGAVQAAPPPPPSTPRPPATAPARGPARLFGRAAEWAAVAEAYAAAEAGSRIIAIEGEAGIGKTSLAEAFVTDVAAHGAAVLIARCYAEQANVAYAPLAEALRVANAQRPAALEDVAARSLAEAARLVPELSSAQAEPSEAGPSAQYRFFEGLSEVVAALTGGSVPGVLLIDDIHWADEGSMDLLAFLLHRLREHRLLFVLTWRPEEASGRGLQAFLSRVGRMDGVSWLALAPLDAAAVQEFVVSEWGTASSPEFVQRLHHETNGVPHLLAAYLGSGPDVLSDAHGSWPLPQGIRGVLGEKLSRASGLGTQLLTAGAVLGSAFDFDTLVAVSGRGEDEAVEAVEELMSLRILREQEQPGIGAAPLYDFTHESLRTLVYADASAARKRLLHRRAAAALTGRGRGERDSTAAQIAHHHHAAGNATEAAGYFKAAGDHARALFANADAVAHYQSALGLDHREAALLHVAIGDSLILLGRYTDAQSSYEQAAAAVPEDRRGWIERRLGDLHTRMGEWVLAESHYEAAQLALDVDGDPAERAGLLVERGFVSYRRGDPERAASQASEALGIALNQGDIATEARARNMLGMLANHRGDVTESREQLQRSLDLALASESIPAIIAAKNNLALAYAADEPERALSLTEEALELSRQQGDRHREAALLSNIADLLRATGLNADAMARIEESVAIYADIGIQAGAYQPEIWKLSEW